MPVAVANAGTVAVLAAVTFTQIGMFYVPLAVLMWAAVVVPWRFAHGLDLARSPLWRIFGGVLIGLPGLLLISGQLTGAILLQGPSFLIPVVSIALGVLFGFGLRASYFTIAALGFAVMVLVMIDLGLLTLAIWWAGGAYLVIGLTAVATLRPLAAKSRGKA